jgi:aminoglycoside 6'-N-acetyltransferase
VPLRVPITFRPLRDHDLPLLHGWLNDPAVVRWWEGDDVRWPAVVRDYCEASTREAPEEHHLALDDGRPFGWIQCYPAAAYPEEGGPWTAAGADPACAGIDYLIGRPEDRGRGLGPRMIAAFVEQVVFPRHLEWTQVGAAPDVGNTASWGSLAKAGFRHLADVPDKDGTGRLMVLDRPDR